MPSPRPFIISRAVLSISALVTIGVKQHPFLPWLKDNYGHLLPKLLVQHGDKSAVIEVKIAPPLLGAVAQSREYGDHFGAQPVICVPDTSFERIPESVKDFAGRVNVRLYPVSQIEDALKLLLE